MLGPGFKASEGSYFRSSPEPCLGGCNNGKSFGDKPVIITSKDILKEEYEDNLEIENTFFDPKINLLYPNPTSSSLNITLDDAFIGGQISVYDIMGKLMHQSVLNSTYTTLDCFADFPVGIYQVIMTNGNLMETQKVVKE